jgi:hypothetical protein
MAVEPLVELVVAVVSVELLDDVFVPLIVVVSLVPETLVELVVAVVSVKLWAVVVVLALVKLVLVTVLEKVAVVSVTLTVVIVAVTTLIDGSAIITEPQSSITPSSAKGLSRSHVVLAMRLLPSTSEDKMAMAMTIA